ncbi:hypothetical protein [Psychrobacter sp.]|uniref:hypothetical protein n=1 Tax=Psychrobacter sp. TaxID=56811 RepID=UPI0025EBB6A5|nr:hypothetical protein [Psychrobacter sp.]
MHHIQFSNNSQPSLSTRLRTVMQVVIIGASSFGFLSGCQATKGVFGNINDGSLAYQKAKKLDPIKLPADQDTAPFIPFYPTPAVGVNTLEIKNDSGKRFELPPPYRQVSTNNKASE